MLLRLMCLVFVGGFLCGRENAQILSTNPELIEGPWETTGTSGIDGIFLTIATGLNWQAINIRVYHRVNGKETWGYFATREKATAESYRMQDAHSFTRFDGTHLRIHFVEVTGLQPFDLDLTFSPSSREWSGTWPRPDQVQNVTLRRPELHPGPPANPFVGDWATPSAKNSLHIRESSDGALSAWLDRSFASSDQRNGELLYVLSSTAPKLDLEWPADISAAHRYHGTLSDDGQMLAGDWAYENSGGLNAPDRFQRVPN
jgi:hypothetical protein